VSAPGLKLFGARRVSTRPRTRLFAAQLNKLHHKPDDCDDQHRNTENQCNNRSYIYKDHLPYGRRMRPPGDDKRKCRGLKKLRALQHPFTLFHFEGFEEVARLDIRMRFEGDAAFKACADFRDVILEATQR
jgi:hypothetical protein